MALITRLSRLFQADFNAVLDRIEEPDLQLKQAVREMQLMLDQDEQRLALLRHELEQLGVAGGSIDEHLAVFEDELDICLAAGKDDLARDLIRRKLASKQQGQRIRRQAVKIEQQCQSLQARVGEQRQQLEAMQQKLQLLVVEESGPSSAASQTLEGVRDEEVEIALLREKQRRAAP